MRKNKDIGHLYPPQVYSGISDDPDSWGMCCSKEMAHRCAESHWDARKSNTVGTIALAVLVALCTAGGTCIVAVLLLMFTLSVVDIFVQISGLQLLYQACGVLLLMGFVPLALSQWKELCERIRYGYAIFDWIGIPVMIVSYITVVIGALPMLISGFTH